MCEYHYHFFNDLLDILSYSKLNSLHGPKEKVSNYILKCQRQLKLVRIN